MLSMNGEQTTEKLQNFLKKELHRTGLKRAVLGLSGGVDSAVVASLLVRSLGADNVHGLIMPFRDSDPNSQKHAELLAGRLKLSFEVKDISPMVDAFFAEEPDASILRKGNKMARERMCFLYDYSAKQSALVVGTSNKTEILLGYGTIFGDLACAINPVGNLYKSQIWELAAYLDVPAEIITKAPSADLWVGQTDEEELGYTYQELDTFLYSLIELNYSDEQLQASGYSTAIIQDIKYKIEKNRFKGRPPLIA